MSKSTIVVCNGITTKGKPCQQTIGVINGFCPAHRKQAKKVVKIAQPVGGSEDFSSLIDAVNAGSEQSDGTTKIEFVKGEWTEVTVDVAGDVIAKSEELAKEAVQTLSVINGGYKYDYVQATAIIDQYSPLLKYTSLDRVKDTRELASILVDVVKLTQTETENEWMRTTDAINRLSLKVKHLREDAKSENDGVIPPHIMMDVLALDEEIFQLKQFKGILQASLELHEEAAESPLTDGPIVDDNGNGDSVFTKMKGFFKKLGKRTLILLNILVLLIVAAVHSTNSDMEPTKHKANPTPIVAVDDKPAHEHVPADWAGISNAKPSPVDDKPAVAAPVPADGVYVVHNGDTLWDIAVEIYGDGNQWHKIYDANHDTLVHDDIRNLDDAGHWIHAGQSLKIFYDDDMTSMSSIHDALNDH